MGLEWVVRGNRGNHGLGAPGFKGCRRVPPTPGFSCGFRAKEKTVPLFWFLLFLLGEMLNFRPGQILILFLVS